MYKSTILIIIFNCLYFCAIALRDTREQKPPIISFSGVDDIIKNITNFRSKLAKGPGKQDVEDPTVIVSLPLVYLFAPKRRKPRARLFKGSSLVGRSNPPKRSPNVKPNKPWTKYSSQRNPGKHVAKHPPIREPSNPPAISGKSNTPEKLFFWKESSEKHTKLSSREHSEVVKSTVRLLREQAEREHSSWKEPNKSAKPFLRREPSKTSWGEHEKLVKPSPWDEHSEYISGGRNKVAKLSSLGGRSKTVKPSWGLSSSAKFSGEQSSDPVKLSWAGCNMPTLGGCSQLTQSGRRLIEGGVPDQKITPNLNDYVRMMAKSDMLWLNSTAESIKDELNLTVNVAPMIKTMLSNYVKNINRHLGSLKRIYSVRKYDALEKDLVYINLIDASSRVVYNELKLFWNQLVDTSDGFLNAETISTVSQQLYKSSIQHTKDEFKTLCRTRKICRPFPAFSDHLAGICSEVLKLNDEKLSEFVDTLYTVIKGKTEFYKFIMGDELSENFGQKSLNLIKGDINDVREAFSVFRGVISQRFYPVESADQTIEEKTKAGRILIHLVDSTFAKDDEEAMSLHFSALKDSLQDWAADFRNDVETILFTTMIYVSDVLEKHWDRGTREQTRSVLQLLLKDGSVTVVR